jgi:hypothetical protein
MTFADPTGRQWSHQLKVEYNGTVWNLPDTAFFFLDFLTLDLIGEDGKRPRIPHASFAEGRTVSVFWDHPFTFDQLQEVAETTLDEQAPPVFSADDDDDGDDADEPPAVIVKAWYDSRPLTWIPKDQ